MIGSQNTKDFIYNIYSSKKSVFRLIDIVLATNDTDEVSLVKKLHYYVKKGQLLNPRKGIYTKIEFNKEELACAIYSPCYLSFEYVLQKEGIVFQYDSRFTVASYLSRELEIGTDTFVFRKLKPSILFSNKGIKNSDNLIFTATAERAILDVLYHNKVYYFDNLNKINKTLLFDLLPLYNSKALTKRVQELFEND